MSLARRMLDYEKASCFRGFPYFRLAWRIAALAQLTGKTGMMIHGGRRAAV